MMNNLKAKTQMVASASRPALALGAVSPQTSRVELSTGTYREVILPLLANWDTVQHSTDTSVGTPDPSTTVLVQEVRADTEQTGLVTQVVATLLYNGDKIVLHCFHTNQSLMVQGIHHSSFLEHFLFPTLQEAITEREAAIREYNDLVAASLGERDEEHFVTSSK